MHKSAYSTSESCLLLMTIYKTSDTIENKSQLAEIWNKKMNKEAKSAFTLHYIQQPKNSWCWLRSGTGKRPWTGAPHVAL